MQGSTKPVIVLNPPPSHLANALQLNASASPAQILLISGDSSSKESRQESRNSRSSWIRRLKPRDELELSKGGLGEAFETTNSKDGDFCERMDIGSGSVRPGCFRQDRAASPVRARPNWQDESDSDAKRQKMSERKACDGAEKQTRMIEPGNSMSSTAVALPSNVGFGPWVNLSSGKKPDMKSELVLGSKNVVSTVSTSTQESSKDIQGNFCSAFSWTTSMPRCSTPAIFYKPPLSPVHSKLGLPPRPPNQKAPGSHSGMGRGGFHQFARDVQPSSHLFETPLNREDKQFVGVQAKDASEIAEAAIGRSESAFQKLSPSEQSFSNSTRDHRKGLSDCRKGNNNLPVRQPIGSCSAGVAVQFENGRRGADLHKNLSREGARETICTNLPSDGVDLHLKVSVPGMEVSKAASKNGPRLQTASMEPNKTPLQQSTSGSSHGTATSSKADASASTSASLPWEMFIETSGDSRKAREQFVEVYNRARNELKNQRMSQTMSRASAREMDGGPKLTLGLGDTASDHLERQLLKRDQHLAGHSQAQGRLNVLSTNLEHRTSSLESSPKEQHSISLVERKGPVTTLANEQSGLDGVSLKPDTPWKQADGFRRDQQALPEGQPRSNVMTVVQEGDQQLACQRLDERSVAHSKGLRPGDKAQFFSSTSAASTKELVSKLNEGSGGRLSHQPDDRKEPTAALGRRSGVTFEQHSISRIAEKATVSRARPQSSPHVWLQRWHPTNSKGLPEAQVPSDGKGSDSVSYLALGMKKFNDGDGVGVFSRSKDLKNVSADNEKGVKRLKTSPSSMLPSAAAMAIVGTAARQFCSAQPQRKGSFAFWSGFGMQPPRRIEPVQEKEKDKMFLKADMNMHNC